jgi:ribosomal protein S20
MPNIQQQKKRVRTAAKQRLENLRYQSTAKTLAKRLAAAVERHIILDERSLAVFLRHNEVARMAHRWSVFRSRNKQQADGLLH